MTLISSTTTLVPLLVKCGHHWSLGGILFLLIGGAIIGVVGKMVAPGDRTRFPLWLTILCGIVGIFIGNWLYVDVLGGRCATGGIDWLRHIVQVISAAVIVMVAASLTGRSRTRT